jgi:hypothetical protein
VNTNGRYTLAGEFKISYVWTSGAAKSSYWKTPCYLCHRRKTQIHSLLTPCRPHKSGCWGWNTSLPRNEVSSHPVLGLSPCVGISPWFRRNVCSMLCLSICVIWHLDSPTAISVSLGKGAWLFVLWHKRDVCRLVALCQLLRRTCQPWGTNYWS